MTDEEIRGLCFQSSTGETVRVHDAICWRHLEGRPCRSAQDRQAAESVDIVIIPVIPSGSATSKRAPRGAHAPPAVSASAPTYDAGEGSTTTTTTTNNNNNNNNNNIASDYDRDGLLCWCAKAQAALTSGGLRATVDDCPRQTPGAKYHVWENRGVGLRVEVGRREAASATFSLALHPRLAHLLPLAARAAAGTGQADAGHARGRAGRTSLRLGGLTPEALVAACLAVLRARDGSLVTDTADEKEPVPPGWAASTGSKAESHWCGKLHLWPDVLAAWGTTDAAVAALQEHLAATATTATAACGSLSGNAAGGRHGGDSALPCAGGGDGASLGQRPCVPHLRHLLQLGRPCYCGRGHYSLQELQREVERRYCGSQAGGDPGQREQLQPQKEESIVTWVAAQPPTPPSPGLQQRAPRGQRSAPSAAKGQAPDSGSQAGAEAGLRACGLSRGPNPESNGGVGGLGDVHDGDGDDDGDDGVGHDGFIRVVLLVGDIREGLRAAAVQGELAAAFARFGCLQGVQVSRTRSGGHHGWARVLLAGPTADEAAAAAVAALDGQLRLGGAPVTVSYSCGRLDTIFPYLPYIVRSALRVDSTAAYSATDQATAARMTDLLAILAERLMLLPTQGPLLPLTVTDATACCGGNALSFARRFQRVVAVELDPDRADDLRHNTALVRVWETFRSDASRGSASPPCGAPGPPAAAPAGGPAGVAASDDAPSSAAAAALPPSPAAAPGVVSGSGLLGCLEVICGDYTQLMGSLQQDIVFMDPPWGGPQYGSVTRAVRPSGSSAVGASVAGLQLSTASPPQPPRRDPVKASMAYGDTAFMLGDKPLSHIVSELMAGGAAGMVALKLPTRAVAELRAMQSRVRQLVKEKLQEGGAAPPGHLDRPTGGDGSGGDSDGDDDTEEPQLGRCGPRLLGAEVTFGRSALVVFMLLPYRRGGCTAYASSASAGGITDEGAGQGRGAGGDGQPSTVGHAISDDAGSRSGVLGSKPRSGCGKSDDCGNSDGGDDAAAQQRHREGTSAAAFRRGCAACEGLGLAFRAALKECCMPYGLPYRFLCD